MLRQSATRQHTPNKFVKAHYEEKPRKDYLRHYEIKTLQKNFMVCEPFKPVENIVYKEICKR
jgi:hypothetical protein